MSDETREEEAGTFEPMSCALPWSQYEHVVMAHGGGGRLTHQIIEHMILPALHNPILEALQDGAICPWPPRHDHLVLTTDSYVVHPIFFPGGDIGKLAVFGTINDLAMCGARPVYLTLSLILEEGLPMVSLQRIADSIREATRQTGVMVVTGDTKVIERPARHSPGLMINTAGVGVKESTRRLEPEQIQAKDQVLVSGDIGRHGMAIMAAREGLAFASNIESDVAPLYPAIQHLLAADIEVRCFRDLTRGGLATALFELASRAKRRIVLQASAIPVRPDVQAACELLGLDPLYVANEGRFAAIVAPHHTEHALSILQSLTPEPPPAQIGEVTSLERPPLVLQNVFGSRQILAMLSGEQLPRIC